MFDGQPLACFQPFIDTATGRVAGVEALGRLRQADGSLQSVGPLFADPRRPAVQLRRLDRQIRDNALSRLHDWFAPDVRLPMVECSDAAKAAVDAAMAGAGLV